MKRIVVALALECEPLYKILRAARKHREVLELDEATQRWLYGCLLYTSPSPRDKRQSRMPSSA